MKIGGRTPSGRRVRKYATWGREGAAATGDATPARRERVRAGAVDDDVGFERVPARGPDGHRMGRGLTQRGHRAFRAQLEAARLAERAQAFVGHQHARVRLDEHRPRRGDPGEVPRRLAAEICSTPVPAAASARAMAPTVASSPIVTWPVTWRSRRPEAASRSR